MARDVRNGSAGPAERRGGRPRCSALALVACAVALGCASDGGGSASGSDGGAAGSAGASGSGGALLGCNGHPDLCDRRLDQVVFPATHNSMSNEEEGWRIPNQVRGIVRQLEDGVRAFLIDTHDDGGVISLCHSLCSLGSEPLEIGLRKFVRFLEAKPREVVVLIVQDETDTAATAAAFDASGLSALAYAHAEGAPWPTLRELIESGRRVVVTAERGRPPPAYYHHVWDVAWDTPYSFQAVDDFSCDENRGSRSNALFLLNHWLEAPLATKELSAVANEPTLLLDRARRCQTESGKLPNFVAVNHYTIGGLFEVVRELNGLPPACPPVGRPADGTPCSAPGTLCIYGPGDTESDGPLLYTCASPPCADAPCGLMTECGTLGAFQHIDWGCSSDLRDL